ncbi:phosphoenolpyruvate--protein phosphotransferase [Deferribacter thermophilus]|uniref:phosphoenolpyruvate--protein phosphotransferase n=1 Tax=Deferribacter thermophilus TaxID=53573 RepID=UPI003C22F41D
MIVLKGIAASEGIAVGKAFFINKKHVKVNKIRISDDKIAFEIRKFKDAIKKAEEYIKHIKDISLQDLGEEHSFIFDVYLLLLKDDMLIGETERVIKNEKVNAEYALLKVSKKLIEIFEKTEDPYIKEKKNDVKHIVNKIIKFMTNDGFIFKETFGESRIAIAHDLSPSELVSLLKQNIVAFATDLGSKISHTSIIARAMGIPAVVGLEKITDNIISEEEMVIIDGFKGVVIISPNSEVLNDYLEKEKKYKEYINELQKLKNLDVKTKDGEIINIFSNVEINEEIEISNDYNAQGIGLYRTEFIYLEKGDVSEDEQFLILKDAVLKNKGKPITIRTFDLGGEKLANLLPHPDEQNPAMGLRAIRYSLRFKDMFKTQIKAILRAAVFGDVRIMFPMVSGVEEIRQAKSIVKECEEDLKREKKEFRSNIPLGVMVELPSLALITHLINKEVDFFSVGTNDLIQYTIGIDRNNEYVAYLYRPTHPAVLTLLRKILKDAQKAGIEVTVCGEMAGDPKYIPVLLGLGYRNLSMSPSAILKAKMMISKIEIEKCEKLITSLKRCKLARNAEEKLDKFVNKYASDVFFH